MPTKPTALGFIAAFEVLLDYLGPDAFGAIEIALFHSGPPKDIIHEVFGRAKRNVTHAKKNHSNRAKANRLKHKLHAYMLEDTKAGIALEGLDLYGYFAKYYYPDIFAGDDQPPCCLDWSVSSKWSLSICFGSILSFRRNLSV